MSRPRRPSLVLLVAACGLSAWPVSAQQAPRGPQHEHAPSAKAVPRQLDAGPLAGMRRRFDELFARTSPDWRKLSTKRKAEMFDDFLTWPRNPLEVELTVRLTSVSGAGQIIGTLTVKNGESMVADRKETALFIKPNLRGLRPGLYAFHVHENADCGPALKDGKLVPGLAAGNHLWLSGTGAFSGTTFSSHLGDLSNLAVDADGTAAKVVAVARLTLADVVKRAFVIHASQDDNSARLACAALN